MKLYNLDKVEQVCKEVMREEKYLHKEGSSVKAQVYDFITLVIHELDKEGEEDNEEWWDLKYIIKKEYK